MIDLPGLKYIQEGEDDIDTKIKGIWQPYISNENAVILVTIQATSDDSTSQAVQIARKPGIDPKG